MKTETRNFLIYLMESCIDDPNMFIEYLEQNNLIREENITYSLPYEESCITDYSKWLEHQKDISILEENYLKARDFDKEIKKLNNL